MKGEDGSLQYRYYKTGYLYTLRLGLMEWKKNLIFKLEELKALRKKHLKHRQFCGSCSAWWRQCVIFPDNRPYGGRKEVPEIGTMVLVAVHNRVGAAVSDILNIILPSQQTLPLGNDSTVRNCSIW